MATKATADNNDVHVALTPSPDAHKGPKALQQALGLEITDKASQASVREVANDWKRQRKAIETYYRTGANNTGIIQPLYTAYKAALAMMELHLAPFDEAIAFAEKLETTYVRERKAIEAAEAEETRLKAEAEEVKRRQKEADRAEAAALKLEDSSAELSDREQSVVARILGLLRGPTHHASASAWLAACKAAGYKDPVAASTKMIRSEKIGLVIANAINADRIREESEAKQAAPINVEVVTKASEIVDGGVRTYYGCGEVDLIALCRRAVERYDAGDIMPLKALQPDLVFLNDQARQLKESFPMVWGPACKLAKRDGTVGR